MVDTRYIVYQDGERQMIERLSYPRFKGVITFNSTLSDIEDIELLDDVMDVSIIALAMREAAEFLLTQNITQDGQNHNTK